MSTLATNNITDAAGGNTATINGMTPTADSLQGFRNRILNGGMVIDQRNAGASVTATGNPFTLDRWRAVNSQAAKFTVQQNAGSVTLPVGFTNYLGVTSSSAHATTSTDYFFLRQTIEGFNVADLAWGTASAAPITLSFRVYSSLTGTFGGALQNDAQNRSYPFSFSIPVANTWTTVSITIAGDITGTWATNNAGGILVGFGLGVGSTYSGTAGAWAGANYFSATGATSVVGTSGATFYITGVQLEAGSVATPFERRPYGTELALCQRYFINWVGNSSDIGFLAIGTGVVNTATTAVINISTPVTLRATPTLSFSGTLSTFEGTVSPAVTSFSVVYTPSANGFWASFSASSGGMTIGRGIFVYTANASTNVLSASAEL